MKGELCSRCGKDTVEAGQCFWCGEEQKKEPETGQITINGQTWTVGTKPIVIGSYTWGQTKTK